VDITSAVVEGERSGTPSHQIFCRWDGVPPNIVGVSRNGGAVAFPQMPCPNNELNILSESPQKRNMNLPEADKPTRRSIRRIEHFKGKPESKMTEAKSCACASLFGTMAL